MEHEENGGSFTAAQLSSNSVRSPLPESESSEALETVVKKVGYVRS